MTLDELIAFLNENGFKASVRDWAAGHTALVTRLQLPVVGGILALPGATHVWPKEGKLHMMNPPHEDLQFNTKEELLAVLQKHFDASEEFHSKQEAGLATMREARSASTAARDATQELAKQQALEQTR